MIGAVQVAAEARWRGLLGSGSLSFGAVLVEVRTPHLLRLEHPQPVLSPGAGVDVTVELRPRGLLRLRGRVVGRIDGAAARQRGERPGYLVEIPARIPPPLAPPEDEAVEPAAPAAVRGRALPSRSEPPAPAAAPSRLRRPDAVDVILLVDDDRVLARMMEVWLGKLGYRTCVVRSLADARARLADPELHVRAAVVDALLPDGQGGGR